MANRTRKTLAALLLVMAALTGAALASVRQVGNDEMSPSIKAGEHVLIVPLAPIRGDVVALPDPLDPGRIVLRRVIAGGGQRVTYENGELRVDVKRVRQKEMNLLEAERITQETMWSKPPARANTWLLRYRKEGVKWSADPVLVPDGSWYLLADDRDGSLDSRWWGPIPEDHFKGVVRLRWGQADLWRPAVEILNPIP